MNIPPGSPGGPTHGAVVLFIIAISTTILLVAGGAAAAVYTATHHADTARSQLQSLIGRQQRELHASCDFWRELAGIPITIVPPATKPSRLGVSIIVRSRVAYEGQDCGILPPADPTVRKWAAYYHLPLQ